ncbi:hypothetical protein HY312_04350 [Candidatus Saccharibacteria bacterium]|nr:hypothetical protein [Candidatus Saccharibacteria bacterium]
MEDTTQKQPTPTRTFRRKTVIIGIAAILAVVGVSVAAIVTYTIHNSPQKILTDSIVNSIGVEKSTYTISYTKASGETGLKSATLKGSYEKNKGYAADAAASFGQGDYQVAVKGKVALDRSAKAYYIYETVDDGQIVNQAYRMNADTQQAVQDNFKAKWTVTSIDTIGQGSSCVVGLLQKAQNDPSLVRTLMQAMTVSNAVDIHTDSSSLDSAVYSVKAASGTFVDALKDTKQYTQVKDCDAGATEAVASGLKSAVFRFDVDTKQRQIKKIDVDLKEGAGTSKVTVQITPDSKAEVTIPKDAKPVQTVQ